MCLRGSPGSLEEKTLRLKGSFALASAGTSYAPTPLRFSRSGGFAFPWGQARPRGRGRAWGTPMPSASGVQAIRYPPAQGRPDGPDAVPVRPVGVAVPLLARPGSPLLGPPSHSAFRAHGRVPQGPPRAPGREPLRPLPGTFRSLTWP